MAPIIRVRTPLVPFSDLLAENPPESFLGLDLATQVGLAILSGQGPNGPKLVAVDANGGLLLGAQAQGQLGDVRIRDFTGAQLTNWLAYGDGQGVNVNHLLAAVRLQAFNGTTADRLRTLSAANLAAQTGNGGLIAAPPGLWSVTAPVIANGTLTLTKAAGAAGVRHVLCGFYVELLGTAQVAAFNGTWAANDGGTALLQGAGELTATVGDKFLLVVNGLNIPGTTATAMSLQVAATGAGVQGAGGIWGYDAV